MYDARHSGRRSWAVKRYWGEHIATCRRELGPDKGLFFVDSGPAGIVREQTNCREKEKTLAENAQDRDYYAGPAHIAGVCTAASATVAAS